MMTRPRPTSDIAALRGLVAARLEDRSASWRSLRAAVALPFLVSNYRVFQFNMVLVYAIVLLGSEYSDRLQRPDLARARRVLRDRRLCRRDSDGSVWLALLGDAAGRRAGVLRVRIPVRVAGAAVARPLSRAGHLCAGRGDAADPQVQAHRAVDRRRAGHRDHQARSAVRTEDHAGPVAVPVHARDPGGDVRARLEPAARARRACDDGDPRPSDRGRSDGREQRAVQDARHSA